MGIKIEHREKIEKMGYKILEEYERGKGKWHQWKLIVQDEFGYKYDVYPWSLLDGEVPEMVRKNNKYSLDNISLWLKLNNKDFELCKDNVYIRSNIKLKFYHQKCKDYFYTSWENVHTGQGCGVCHGKQVGRYNNFAVKFPHLLNEWDYNKNGDPSNYTPFSHQKVWWKCFKCGFEWKTKISVRTSKKPSGCPNCVSSLGEKRVEQFLYKNKYFYIPEYNEFKDCKNKYVLSFDFYLPNENICIEYQGMQHYKVVGWFGGKEKLKRSKKNDKIKFNYCKRNKIKLIVIPYWKYNEIEQILQKELMEV